MKHPLRPLILLASAAFLSLTAPGAPPLVLQHVSVIPMDRERVLPDRTVVIEGGRITAIRPSQRAETPAGAQVIDGSGKYLMPGLAEMHAHVPGTGQEEGYRQDVLFLYLANGVTLIRGMLGDPLHLELREKLASGELPGPRLITSGPSLNGRSTPSPERGVEWVRRQAAEGYDFLKLAPGLSRATFDAIAQTAHAVGIPFSGHVSEEVGVSRALEAGYASIDHLDGYMPTLVDSARHGQKPGGFFGYLLAPHAQDARIRDIARRTREAGVWNVPTETIMHNFLTVDLEGIRRDRPEFRTMPRAVVDGWINAVRRGRTDPTYNRQAAEAFLQLRLKLIKALHDAGAGLLLGSDAPQWFNVPGFSLHREMALMAKAGLSPFEVLKTGTVNPARFFGQENEFGQVAEGMRADLVLLEANPLEDLQHASRIAGVIRDGRWLPRTEIEARLAEMVDRRQR